MEVYRIKVAESSPLRDFVAQEKVAVPITPLLSTAFTLPSVYEAGSNVLGGLADGVTGDTDTMGKKLMIAGLAGLSAMPFIGSAAKGLGHIGRAFKVHGKTGKLPTTLAGLGQKGVEPGKFIKAMRTPHNKLFDYVARRIGPERSKALGNKLLDIGHIGNLQPFRFMDRGFRTGGIVGKLAPSIGSSLVIDYFSAPARQRLYEEIAQGQSNTTVPGVQPVVNQIRKPGALYNWLEEQRDRNERLNALFEPPEAD